MTSLRFTVILSYTGKKSRSPLPRKGVAMERNEYEIVSYNNISFHIFIVNPYNSHEIKGTDDTLIVSLQVSPLFFSHYFPQIEDIAFDHFSLHTGTDALCCGQIRAVLFDLASAYYQHEDYAPVRCAMLVNRLFLCLLDTQTHHVVPQKEKQARISKGQRMRRIIRYIDEHSTEKLLLSDIARQEQLDLYYLSHFFRESFGISFQSYLTKIRCEHARHLLLTNDSLPGISLSCGFSDQKYFKKGFLTQYGCTPKDYRRRFRSAHPKQQRRAMLTTQKFLSDRDALAVLEKYR